MVKVRKNVRKNGYLKGKIDKIIILIFKILFKGQN